eukprot:UN26266
MIYLHFLNPAHEIINITDETNFSDLTKLVEDEITKRLLTESGKNKKWVEQKMLEWFDNDIKRVFKI